MILLVPITPEVPKRHRPHVGPGLIFVLALAVAFLEIFPLVEKDAAFVEGVVALAENGAAEDGTLNPVDLAYLQMRPLLQVTPAKGDWDIKRLVLANFVHGSHAHLLLNLIAAFAGARICSTFLPLFSCFLLFIVAGSLGLFASMMLSTEASIYIPHVGASAGIFALMGAYYVYNFRFRTKYFFWFPSKRGFISLPTSWFFFIDVIMIELLLSVGQFFPNQLDGVDHLAHVVGFGCGALLALTLRYIQHWPSFLHTRAEYRCWSKVFGSAKSNTIPLKFEKWIAILEINPYNDLVKTKLVKLVESKLRHINDAQIDKLFSFVCPVFVHLRNREVASLIRQMIFRKRKIPDRWYVRTPYDSIITLAKRLATSQEEQYIIYEFVEGYRVAREKQGQSDPKLELLMRRLGSMVTHPEDNKKDSSSPAA